MELGLSITNVRAEGGASQYCLVTIPVFVPFLSANSKGVSHSKEQKNWVSEEAYEAVGDSHALVG